MKRRSIIKHTHRGHCQYCLRVCALDTRSGLVATHGYVVAHGYFKGVCPGGSYPSLHESRTQTNEMIKFYLNQARALAALAQQYEKGVVKPTEARLKAYGTEVVPYDQASIEMQRAAIIAAIALHQKQAKLAMFYKLQLQTWAARIFDNKMPPYRVEDIDLPPWKAGDMIRVGGRKGFEAKIKEIADRPVGIGRRMMPHALVDAPPVLIERKSVDTGSVTIDALPSLKTLWLPLRQYKRPSSPLVRELKEANLL